MNRFTCIGLLLSLSAAACGGPVTCAPGEVPNDALQACVIPKECDGGVINERNQCEVLADAGGEGSSRESALSSERADGSTSAEPAVDPAVAWMCTKNSAGNCTSCQQDDDCATQVCERGFCMDCRESTQCMSVAASCISNRCVPDRKPSGIWTTSGGGLSTADGLKLQLSIGTPSPAAAASNSGYRLSVAPGSGNY